MIYYVWRFLIIFEEFDVISRQIRMSLEGYVCKLGCKRVQMGANGCGWMLMGALGHIVHKQHKNKVRGGNFWSLWSGYGRYGRGNFPRHDVCGCWPKWPRMGKDEYWCIRVGAMGLIVTGGVEKEDKKNPKWASRTCFQRHDNVKKSKCFTGMLEGAREGKGWELCGI